LVVGGCVFAEELHDISVFPPDASCWCRMLLPLMVVTSWWPHMDLEVLAVVLEPVR
jgi:hypothetical protein